MSVWTGKTWHRRNLCAGEKPRHIINNKRPCGSTVFWLSLKSEYAADSPDQYCFMSTESIRLSHSSTLSSVAECNFRENESRETRHYERQLYPKVATPIRTTKGKNWSEWNDGGRKAKRRDFQKQVGEIIAREKCTQRCAGKAGDKDWR